MLAIVFLGSVSIWSWFKTLSWNDALSIVAVLGAIASTIMPYLDAGTFRFFILAFIAVSLKLQNLGNTQEIHRTRRMLTDLQSQADTLPDTSPSSQPPTH